MYGGRRPLTCRGAIPRPVAPHLAPRAASIAPNRPSAPPLTCGNVRPLGFEPRTCGVCVRRSPAFIRVQNVPQLLGSSFTGVRDSPPVFAVRGSPFGSPRTVGLGASHDATLRT